MHECSYKKQIKNKHIYCKQSFKLIVYTRNEREEEEYAFIIERFEKEDEFKMYNVCYWLTGRRIEYKVLFKFIFDKGLKWNLMKYRNYLRLKIRLKELIERFNSM